MFVNVGVRGGGGKGGTIMLGNDFVNGQMG